MKIKILKWEENRHSSTIMTYFYFRIFFIYMNRYKFVLWPCIRYNLHTVECLLFHQFWQTHIASPFIKAQNISPIPETPHPQGRFQQPPSSKSTNTDLIYHQRLTLSIIEFHINGNIEYVLFVSGFFYTVLCFCGPCYFANTLIFSSSIRHFSISPPSLHWGRA